MYTPYPRIWHGCRCLDEWRRWLREAKTFTVEETPKQFHWHCLCFIEPKSEMQQAHFLDTNPGRRRLSTISSRVRFSLSCQHDECDEHDGWRHFHSKWNPASTKKVCHMSQRSSWLRARHMTPMTLCNITGKQSASTSKAKRHTYSIQRKQTTNTDTAYRSHKYMIFFLNWTHNVCRTTFTRKPWSISNL